MFYFTEDLVTSIKRSSLAVISDKTFNDTDIIALANEEMLNKVVPDVLSVRENFFLQYQDIPIIANKARYPLPERAIGNALKDLNIVNAQGTIIDELRPALHDEKFNVTGTSNAFWFSGDEVVLVPTPTSTTNFIRFYYFERPNQLVATTSCAKITAINSAAGTTTFTVNTDLTASLSTGSLVDLLSRKSPFLLWDKDAAITGITSTTIAVSTASVSNEANIVEPQINDYVCPAQYCNIPMIFSEYHPILSELVVSRLMRGYAHLDKLQSVEANLQELRTNAMKLIANRVESNVKHVNAEHSFMNALGTRIGKLAVR